MSDWIALFLFAILIFLSAVFSGAETGIYSISRVRLEAEASEGRRSARILARLLRDDAGLLITLLVGHNLALEIATQLTESRVEGWGTLPDCLHELVATAFLVPAFFLLGELVPKDLFRRRPHLLLAVAAPFLSFFRWAASPLVWPLGLVADGLERLAGLRREDFARALRREEMIEILAESARAGALAPHAEELARNVLVLRHTPLSRVAVPWDQVQRIDLERGAGEAREAVIRAAFTRLPVVRAGEGGAQRVLGYVHQLDLLGAGAGATIEEVIRPIQELDPELPLDRAMARLQLSGQRLALVGSAVRPLGLVTLMDLLATIAAHPRFSQPQATARIGSSHDVPARAQEGAGLDPGCGAGAGRAGPGGRAPGSG